MRRCAPTGDDAGATLTLDASTKRSEPPRQPARPTFKPIPWMNTHHYTSLLKNNNLDGRLAQMIEVRDAEHSLRFALPLNLVLFVRRRTRPSASLEKKAPV